MGCCFSSTGKSPKSPGSPAEPRAKAHLIIKDAILHGEQVEEEEEEEEEEETVKEVLSITPVPKPHTHTTHEKHILHQEKPKESQEPPSELKIPTESDPREAAVVEVASSEYSELCSVGESFSTTTTATTVTEKKKGDDEVTSRDIGEVKPEGVHKPRAKVTRRRPQGGEPAAKRAVVSPGAKGPGLSSGRGRASSPAKAAQQSQRGVGLASTGARRHRSTTDGFGRRSLSPATRSGGGARRSGVGSSPSRKTGNAGSRPMGRGGSGTEEREEGNDDPVLEQRTGGGSEEAVMNDTTNTLVALECFVFL